MFVRSLWPLIIGPDQLTYRNENVNLDLILSFSAGEKIVEVDKALRHRHYCERILYFVRFETVNGSSRYWYYPALRERDLEFKWLQQFQSGPYRLADASKAFYYTIPKVEEGQED